MGIRASHPDSWVSKPPNRCQLEGVSRLTNPRSDEPEIVTEEEDPDARGYLGRIFHVADEALRHLKRGVHRTRRGRVH